MAGTQAEKDKEGTSGADRGGRDEARAEDGTADGAADAAARRSPRETLRDGWLAVLGAVSSAEEKSVAWLLEMAGVPHEKGGDARTEVAAHVRRNRELFEKRVDDGVKAAVTKMRAPIDKELAQLHARLERLQQHIEKRRERIGKPDPARTKK